MSVAARGVFFLDSIRAWVVRFCKQEGVCRARMIQIGGPYLRDSSWRAKLFGAEFMERMPPPLYFIHFQRIHFQRVFSEH